MPTKYFTCDCCNGSGVVYAHTAEMECYYCGGRGEITQEDIKFFERKSIEVEIEDSRSKIRQLQTKIDRLLGELRNA